MFTIIYLIVVGGAVEGDLQREQQVERSAERIYTANLTVAGVAADSSRPAVAQTGVVGTGECVGRLQERDLLG